MPVLLSTNDPDRYFVLSLTDDPDMSSPYTPTRQSPGCVREESLGLEGLTLDSTSEGSCTEPLEDDPHPQHSGYSSMSNTQARGSMDTAKVMGMAVAIRTTPMCTAAVQIASPPSYLGVLMR